jgi:hypothetical protein
LGAALALTACYTPPPNPGYYEAVLSGGQMVPATDSTATGKLSATLNNGKSLNIVGDYSSFDSPVTGVVVSGPAIAGENAGSNGENCILRFTSQSTEKPFNGTFYSTEDCTSQKAENATKLQNGQFYIIVKTMAFPNGEIRGQIKRK